MHLVRSGRQRFAFMTRQLCLTLTAPQLTNPELRQRVSAFAAGLIRVAELVPGESNVLLLLNDGLGASLIFHFNRELTILVVS